MEERHQGGVASTAGAVEAAPPPSPELEPARTAFARGDFRETRRLASELLERKEAPEAARKEATALLASTSNDPLALWLGIGCLVFFVAVVWLTLR